ncbi:hypothetical protein ACA910_009203 [Epithemia clementina (nom. ined.)]
MTLPPLEDSTTCSTYQLTRLISHIGKHTGSGHYVAHVLVPGQPQPSSSPPPQWIIFNDEKVAESEHPPVKHAYLYLFQRTDTLRASSSSSLLRPADRKKRGQSESHVMYQFYVGYLRVGNL